MDNGLARARVMNAVFFDLDGTLADTKADLVETVNLTRRDLGLSILPATDVLKHVGCGAKYLLENAIPEITDSARVTALFRVHYGACATHQVQLYPGMRETLCELRCRGWKLGVVTNKPRFATSKILTHLGLDAFFGEAVVAGGDCPEMKPSATPLFECARRMGGHVLSAGDWMVGDNWTDLACAEAGGISSAFCTYGFGTLRSYVPTRTLATPAEFLI